MYLSNSVLLFGEEQNFQLIEFKHFFGISRVFKSEFVIASDEHVGKNPEGY